MCPSTVAQFAWADLVARRGKRAQTAPQKACGHTRCGPSLALSQPRLREPGDRNSNTKHSLDTRGMQDELQDFLPGTMFQTVEDELNDRMRHMWMDHAVMRPLGLHAQTHDRS